MGGGVSPIEWVLPPVAVTHTLVDQTAKATGAPVPPPTPGSPDDKLDTAQDRADRQRQREQDQAAQQARHADEDFQARTETPQEAVEAKRRAVASAQRLGGGRRRASQTLTDPGMTLGGGY